MSICGTLVEAEFLVAQTRSRSKAEFLADEVIHRALVRSIEIIGEAARQVPSDFRQRHPQVNWRVMAGMRDRLIHGYFTVDLEIVWSTATQEAVLLVNQLQQILADNGLQGRETPACFREHRRLLVVAIPPLKLGR